MLPVYEATVAALGFDPDAPGPDFSEELPEDLYPKDLGSFVTFLMGGNDAGYAGEAAVGDAGGTDVSSTHHDGAPVAQEGSVGGGEEGQGGQASTLPGE